MSRTYVLPFAIVVFLISVPTIASAKVYISEVAWMGAADNANAEWMELYNDGVAQDLTGWSLSATDGQPAIALEGTIGANAYALLERTSDDTVQGVIALLIYTGALGNTGEVLELRDASGVVVDHVNGGTDWELGGDNTTKDTLQRAGLPAVGSWITAPSTPNGGGAVQSVAQEKSADTGTKSTTSAESSATRINTTEQEKKVVPHLKPALTLDLGGDRTVTVGVPVSFGAHAYKESNKEISIQNVTWNFGDGTTAQGKEVAHVYVYTGDYVVTAKGVRKNFIEEVSDTDRFVVHVIEPSFSITHADEKYIEIANTSDHELDLSGHALAVGSESFRIPAGTIVLSKSSVRFPKSVTKLAVHVGTTAGMFYPSDVLASTYRVSESAGLAQVASSRVPASLVSSQKKGGMDFVATTGGGQGDVGVVTLQEGRWRESVPSATLSTSTTPFEMTLPELASAAQAYDSVPRATENGTDNNLLWWLLGLSGAILTALVAVLLIRREQAEVIQGFEIEEE
ncbi:MAG: lamin tail domain-containing protein [Candidatus Pacebacteria bacterium]|nr:lamin tail domain-containing protein [Candidatus Paceibacterota bacterium]